MENTEDELIKLHRTFFWQSEKIIPSHNWNDLDKVYQTLPADIMHVNDKATVALTYIDPVTRKFVGINEDNIELEGGTLLARTVEPSNMAKNIEIAKKFVQRGNKHEVGVLFQHMNINQKAGSDYEWYVSFMKLSDNAKGIFTLDFKINLLSSYQSRFMKIIALDDFVHLHMNKFQELSSREIEILTKVALGSSSIDIGNELFISKLTVDTHRRNIMKKLGIKRFVDLIRFAEAFDLV